MGMLNKGFKDYYKLKSKKDLTPTHLRLKATEPPVPHQGQQGPSHLQRAIAAVHL